MKTLLTNALSIKVVVNKVTINAILSKTGNFECNNREQRGTSLLNSLFYLSSILEYLSKSLIKIMGLNMWQC